MTGEFRTAKGWRILMYILSPMLIGLFVYAGFLPFRSDSFDLTIALILLPVSLAGTIGFTYGLLEIIKGRLIITSSSISNVSVLGTTTLAFDDIKGFRTDGNYIHINSASDDKKSIKTSAYIERSGEILNWLHNNFLELDSYDAQEEEKQVLADSEFGINEQVRKYRLNEAKRLAMYINIVGGAVGAWLWFYPRPYSISLSAGMIVPAIALVSIYIYRGLIRFDQKKNSTLPTIFYGFLFPSTGLLIRSVLDYEILDYERLWIAVLFITIALTFLLIIGTREITFKTFMDYFAAVLFAGIIMCYSFAAYTVLNCLFDKSESEVFTSEVIDKEVSSGDPKIYYLTLKPWGPRATSEKVSVSKDEYETTDNGDTISIHLRQGLLKTPWFYVVTE